MSGTRGSITVKEWDFRPCVAKQVTVTIHCASGFSLPSLNKEGVCKITLFRVTVENNSALIFMNGKNGGKHSKSILSPKHYGNEMQWILVYLFSLSTFRSRDYLAGMQRLDYSLGFLARDPSSVGTDRSVLRSLLFW